MTEAPRVFLTRAGKHGEDEEYALDNGLAIIGFNDVPSLEDAGSYEAIAELVAATYPDAKSRAVGNYSGQLWAFALSLQEGETVVMPRKTTSQVALGRVTGPYKYQEVAGAFRHTRAVEWIRTDVPRPAFEQDLLYSFGAFMTVCNVKRNDAARRVAAVLAGGSDPGPSSSVISGSVSTDDAETETEMVPELSQAAHDQIVAHIQARFAGHALADLVNAVLEADGWVTKVSPPGADGGVDILAGRGPLGLDAPRLCVQVKSQTSATDVTTYRNLGGTLQTFNAEQGLLVCWGGFNKAVLNEAKQGHFTMRLWDSGDLVNAIYANYDRLPPEIQADLPLKKIWTLVVDETDS